MTNRAVDTVNQTIESAASVDLSVMHLIAQADIVVKLVMLSLFLASIWSWAIIIEKHRLFKRHQLRMQRFKTIYDKSKNLSEVQSKFNKQTNNLLAKLFMTASDARKTCASSLSIDDIKERVFLATLRQKHEITNTLTSKLTFLATIGSASPFIGLFGTVWGIVNSFQAIAASKNTTLVVVAPGIAEALLATAIGLFAAIPAVIFYNHFTAKTHLIVKQLDDYCAEFTSLVTHTKS